MNASPSTAPLCSGIPICCPPLFLRTPHQIQETGNRCSSLPAIHPTAFEKLSAFSRPQFPHPQPVDWTGRLLRPFQPPPSAAEGGMVKRWAFHLHAWGGPFHTEIVGAPRLNKNETALTAAGGGRELPSSSRGGGSPGGSDPPRTHTFLPPRTRAPGK